MDRKARPSNTYRRRDSYESPDRSRQRQVRRSRTRSRSPHHSSSQRNTFRNPRGRRTSRSPHSERQHQRDKETPTRKSLFTENGRTKNNLDENIVKKPMYRGPETVFKVDRDIEILVNPNKSSPTRTVSSPSRIVIARPKEGKVSSSNSNSTDRYTYDSRRDHRGYTGRRNDYDRRSADRNPSPSRRGHDYSIRDSYDCRNRSRGETGRNYKNDCDRPERPKRNDSRDRRRRERSHHDDSRTHSSSRRERDFFDDNRRRDRFNGRRRSEEKRRNSDRTDRSDTYEKYTEETHSSDKDDSHYANEEQPEQEENNAVLTPNVAMLPGMFPFPIFRQLPPRPPMIPMLPRLPPGFMFPRPVPFMRPRIAPRGFYPPPRIVPLSLPRPVMMSASE